MSTAVSGYGRAMTEGQKVTAAAAHDPRASVSAGPVADARPVPAEAVPAREAEPPGSAAVRAEEEETEPHVRVDARLIQSAILALRKPIVAASLPLEAPGVEEARQERRKLLSQIDDYLLPRLRESGAPI